MKTLNIILTISLILIIVNFEIFGEDTGYFKLSLIAISSNKAVIQWKTPDEVACKIEYGSNPWDLEKKIDEKEKVNEHQIILENLSASSRYFCQTSYNDTNEKKIIKIPPSPLSFKTQSSVPIRSSLTVKNSEVLATADTKVLLKVEISEPGIIEIKFGDDRNNLIYNKKVNFFGLIHYVIIDGLNIKNCNYYSISAKNIFDHNYIPREIKNLNTDIKINPDNIPENLKKLFIKEKIENKESGGGANRGVRRIRP